MNDYFCPELKSNFFMKTSKIICVLILISAKITAQQPINWTDDQLIQPSQLSEVIKANKKTPVIFSVGPGAIIPFSKDIGMVSISENLKKFKEELKKLPKDTSIVVYCGCCP